LFSTQIAASRYIQSGGDGRRMGKRSGTETVVELMLAFLARGTWTQAELARHVGISAESVRRTLHEMMAKGIPLEREEESPHVYWSVPQRWFPGGIVLRADDAEELLRQLTRAPRSKRRDELMQRIVEAARGKVADAAVPAVVSPQASEAEETFLTVVEDSASQRTALWMRYYAASRGSVEERLVSVQRVMAARPSRFVALCHRDRRLKWFRVDNVMGARLSPGEAYEASAAAEVERFVGESLDGFHQGLAAQELCFRVRDPESRWVAGNLLEGMEQQPVPGGIRVIARTSAPLRVARFVVGLGAAAEVETEVLRTMVEELARGALEARNARSVTSNDRSR